MRPDDFRNVRIESSSEHPFLTDLPREPYNRAVIAFVSDFGVDEGGRKREPGTVASNAQHAKRCAVAIGGTAQDLGDGRAIFRIPLSVDASRIAGDLVRAFPEIGAFTGSPRTAVHVEYYRDDDLVHAVGTISTTAIGVREMGFALEDLADAHERARELAAYEDEDFDVAIERFRAAVEGRKSAFDLESNDDVF